MPQTISGIHHITAIAEDPQKNINFYTGVLGLRLVKVTVNFDDPGSYHLYYGDAGGHPGTILTFFAWPGARCGRRGSGQVTSTSFAIPPGSIPFWADRFASKGITSEPAIERFGKQVITFFDDDGLRLDLIESPNADTRYTWTKSDVPLECAICGFHSATLSETGYQRTATLLSETMGFRFVEQERNRFRYEIAGDGPGTTVDLVCAPDGAEGQIAVGTVHHIAWRTPDDVQQHKWLRELTTLGYDASPVMDRIYFHSIYYREPGGILFEIATDPPGFTFDESLENLGSGLKLPPWLEPHRTRIEAVLPAIRRKTAGVTQ